MLLTLVLAPSCQNTHSSTIIFNNAHAADGRMTAARNPPSWIYPSDSQYEKSNLFLQQLYSKLIEKGMKTKLEAIGQAGFPGCYLNQISIPGTGCEIYGALSLPLAAAYFDRNPLYLTSLGQEPDLEAVIDTLSSPPLAKAIAENIRYFTVGTAPDVNQGLRFSLSENKGQPNVFAFSKDSLFGQKNRRLTINYEFLQEAGEEEIRRQLEPIIRRNPLVRLSRHVRGLFSLSSI